MIKVNFLPYPKGNRDEWIKASEIERLSGPFLQSCEYLEKDGDYFRKSIQSLRQYVCKHNSSYVLPEPLPKREESKQTPLPKKQASALASK
mmetsp:Transcript_27346/g.41588  ORF Transcript_27346/g.41588 Transcript_27346/m.41588 type:complete len:91 (+) Transcript_27346:1107-1379(+)